VVWLSPADRRHFAAIEASLLEELATHLLEHARSERLALPSRPQIELRTDRRLALGECGIDARVVSVPASGVPASGVPASGVAASGVARRPGAPPPGPALDGEILPAAYVDIGGRLIAVPPAGAVIGRSSDADIVIAAGEVSRHHAQIVPDREGWVVADLGSTNGVRLNGRPIGVPTRVEDGDVIELGSVELIFEVR